MERERQEWEKDEAAMAASMQNNKKKLLNDLAEEEAKREDAVRNLQQMKDKEKEGLITSLSNGKTFTTSQRTASLLALQFWGARDNLGHFSYFVAQNQILFFGFSRKSN